MKTAIVSSSELFAQPGVPLSAAYWVTRQQGESYEAWQRRTTAEELERRAAVHEARAEKLRAQAAQLRGDKP